MSVYQHIKAEQLAARKARHATRVNLLTTLLGEFARGRTQEEPSDAQVFSALTTMKANIQLSLEAQPTADLEAKLNEELQVCEELLKLKPADISEEVVRAEIEAILQQDPGAKINTIMPALKAKFGGALNGKMANALITSLTR